jgi:hypothetical protein
MADESKQQLFLLAATPCASILKKPLSGYNFGQALLVMRT